MKKTSYNLRMVQNMRTLCTKLPWLWLFRVRNRFFIGGGGVVAPTFIGSCLHVWGACRKVLIFTWNLISWHIFLLRSVLYWWKLTLKMISPVNIKKYQYKAQILYHFHTIPFTHVHIQYGDQAILETMHCLWFFQICLHFQSARLLLMGDVSPLHIVSPSKPPNSV